MTDNKKAYHIDLNIFNEIEVFTPRIPSSTYEYENKTIPRISLSTSIGGCLTGAPFGGRKLETLSTEMMDFNDENEPFLVFKVYEFDLSDVKHGHLVPTEYLLKKGLVMDANASNEIWVINQTLKPVNSYIMVVDLYDETVVDTFTKEFYNLTEEEMKNVDFEDYYIGSPTVIKNISYQIVQNIPEIPYDVDWESWMETLEELKNLDYDIY